ncbi:MAG: hypothetical protein RLZZ123_1665 [Pseudomonadota bacterium]
MSNCQFKLSNPWGRRAWLGQSAACLLACLAASPLRSRAAASEAPLSDAVRGALGERWRATAPEVAMPAEAQAWQSWALMEVESGFRKHALSVAGAMGYMQIMPFWVRAIGDGDVSGLWRTPINLRYGCVILRHYIQMEDGDLVWALGRYNGTRGQTEYPARVLAAQRAWRQAHD